MSPKASDILRSDLYLQASVYAGSDWGDAGQKAVFNTPGVYGGVTNVTVDGFGYITSNTEELGDNLLLTEGIFGAGTSTEGGDVARKVQFFNYGAHDCFGTHRSMKTIQRADTVILDHVAIAFDGSQDVYSAYPSQNYSINRVRNLILRDDNHIVLNAPAIYIDTVQSMKRIDAAGNLVNADRAIYKGRYMLCEIEDNEVTDANSLCGTPQGAGCGIVDLSGNRNLLLINNGGFLSVLGYRDDNPNDNNYENDNNEYGPVLGYCYLASGDGWEINVFARDKAAVSGTGTTEANNGFWSLCFGDNVTPAISEGNVELDYLNAKRSSDASLGYRSWRLGNQDEGRSRAVTIVANQKPMNYLPHNNWLKVDDSTPDGEWSDGTNTYDHYAIATATVNLPPANGGSYYTLANITVDAENAGEVMLIDAAWNPDTKRWETIGATVDGREIENNPSYNFGLMFQSIGAFEDCAATNTHCTDKVVIAGTNHYASTPSTLVSPAVAAGAEGVVNQLKFYLTYNTEFNTTLIRNVSFVFWEHIPDATAPGGERKLPIYMTVSLATIIEDFGTFATKALAMYNEGIEHKYVRRVVLPAAYEQRHIYLTGIEWAAKDSCAAGLYNLIDTAHRKASAYTDINNIEHTTAKDANNIFSVTMQPGEDVSNTTTTAGWYSVAGEQGNTVTTFDIRNLYDEKTNATDADRETAKASSGGKQYLTSSATRPDGSNNDDLVAWIQSGEPIGVLDGRATASLDFTSC